ncbi:MAG: DUF3426 domain-containing protein, partial [Desulfuromonas sp.]|nr:DUF3426 domain-containing protein [Desulfuromonas sp.]
EPQPESQPEWDADSDAFSFSPSDSFSFDDQSPETSDSSDIFSFGTADEEQEHIPAPSSSEALDDETEKPDFMFESLADENTSKPPVAPAVLEQTETIPAEQEPEPEREQPAPTKVKKRKTSKLLVLLLLMILAIVGVYGYFYMTLGTTDINTMIQEIERQLVPTSQQPKGALHITTTESFYVDNTQSGQLFVVQGLARNDFSQPRAELSVTATLYKKKGQPLVKKTIYCGNTITREDLESLEIGALAEKMSNPFGAALSNVNVAPGQSLPFTIVFNNISDELNEFSVEPGTSKAAAR